MIKVSVPDPADIVAFVATLPHYTRKSCAAPGTYDDYRPEGWPSWGAILGYHNLPKTAASWRKFIEEHRNAKPSSSPDHA